MNIFIVAFIVLMWYQLGKKHGYEDAQKKFEEDQRALKNQALDELAEETEKLGVEFK
jgi:hypothetical protein